MINQEAWNSLPADLQAIVRVACQAAVMDTLSDFTYNNGMALKKLIEEHGVELRRFPDEVLNTLAKISKELMREMANENELLGRIHASFQAYQKVVNPWTAISDRALLNLRPDP
jgi:TRAP-type mannitol/chloroaromatic compound transport system substrate-binding protein